MSQEREFLKLPIDGKFAEAEGRLAIISLLTIKIVDRISKPVVVLIAAALGVAAFEGGTRLVAALRVFSTLFS